MSFLCFCLFFLCLSPLVCPLDPPRAPANIKIPRRGLFLVSDPNPESRQQAYEQDKYHGGKKKEKKKESSPKIRIIVPIGGGAGREKVVGVGDQTVMSCSLSFMSLPLVAFPTGFLTHPMSSFLLYRRLRSFGT
ncbi:hypothetical protein BDZ97DRAFT_1797104 [Flammula alnicola]|nr:hypothetical protein BDZ97DRAFT_1797104 [Flammula alnicola]